MSVKRIVGFALVVLLLGLLGTYFYFKGRRYQVIITQAQIDAALTERFPVTKSFLLIFELTYANPEVTLLPEAQRVRVGMDTMLDVKIKGEKKQLGGGATLTGRVDYRPDTQELFLADAQFERLAVEGVPPEHLEAVSRYASKIAQENVQRFPIYRLKAVDGKTAAVKLLLKDVQIRDREVVVTLGL